MAHSHLIGRGLCVWDHPMPAIDSRMYIVMGEGGEALVVDPNQSDEAFAHLRQNGITKLLVILTHEHFDHISGVNFLRAHFSCRVVCSEAAAARIVDPDKNLAKFWEAILLDKSPEARRTWTAVKDETYACTADETFTGAKEWQWQGHTLRAIPAPGHSKGSAIYFLDDALFSGDSLVNGAGVICRLPGGSWKAYCEKTRPLIEALSDGTTVFPGHGAPARLGELRKYLAKFGTVLGEVKMT